MRGSQVLPEHCSGPLPDRKQQKKSIYRSKAAERLNRTADAPERATRESRSPQVNPLHRKPGARKLIRVDRLILSTVRRSTTVGNAVPFRGCPQLLAGGRTVGTSLQPWAGPELPASTARSSALRQHGRRGSWAHAGRCVRWCRSAGRLPAELCPSTGPGPDGVQSLYSRV